MTAPRPRSLAALAWVAGALLAACGGSRDTNALELTITPSSTTTPATSSVVASSSSTTAVPTAPNVAVAPTGPSTSPSSPSTGASVPDVLRFSAPLVGGGTFNAAELAGAPVLFWFWSPS